MKKYVNPSMSIIEVENTEVMEGSGSTFTESGGYGTTGGGDITGQDGGEAGKGGRRGNSIWDD